jgi:hypothetical protein
VPIRLSLSAALLLLAACGAALVHPGPADAALAAGRWPGTTVPDLERARELYVARCSRCHALHVPEQYPAAAWPQLIARMAPKAKLSVEERSEITRFLVTTSARVRGEALPAREGQAEARR